MYDYMHSVAKLMRAQLRYDPDDLRARYALATSFFESGNIEGALSEFWQILDADREFESGEALFASALCLATLGQHSDALIYLHEATALQGVDYYRCTIARSRSLAALHRFSEAEACLREALDQKSARTNAESLATLWSELAKVLYLVGMMDKSDAAFFKAATYAPRNAEIQARRALFYLQQGSLTEAKIPLEKAMQMNPKNAYSAIARAEYYRQVGNIETASFLLESLPSDAHRILKEYNALYKLALTAPDKM